MMNDRLKRLWPFIRPDNPTAPIRGKKRHIEVALSFSETYLNAGDLDGAERYLLVAEHRAGLITDNEYERWSRGAGGVHVG
jgi:hypothetical protein